ITDDEDERRSNSISSESNESNQTVSDTGSDNDNYSDADNSDNESDSISSSSEQSGDEQQQQRNNGRLKLNKNKIKNIHEQQQFIDDGDVSEQEQWNTTNTSVNINGINVNVSDIYDEQELQQLENGNNNNNNNISSSSQNTTGKQNSHNQNGIVQGWTAEITSLFLCWLVVQRAMEEQQQKQLQQQQDGNGNENQSKTGIEKDIDKQTQLQMPTQQSQQQQRQQQSSSSKLSTSSTQQQQQYPTLCSSPFSFDEVPSSQLPDLTPQLFAHSGGWAFIEFIRIVAAYTKLFRMKKEDIENQGPFQDKIRIKDQNLNGNLIGNEKIKGNGKGISIGQQKKRQQQTIEKRFDDKQANVFEKIPALSEFIEQQDIIPELQLQLHLQPELQLQQQQQQQQQQSTSSQSIKEQTSSIFMSLINIIILTTIINMESTTIFQISMNLKKRRTVSVQILIIQMRTALHIYPSVNYL
ncbi:MAG: hypothetical protein EZS28_040492, partial [Streblomastix strix]